MTDEERLRTEASQLLEHIGNIAFEMRLGVWMCDDEDVGDLMEDALVMREYATDLWDRLMRLRREEERGRDDNGKAQG